MNNDIDFTPLSAVLWRHKLRHLPKRGGDWPMQSRCATKRYGVGSSSIRGTLFWQCGRYNKNHSLDRAFHKAGAQLSSILRRKDCCVPRKVTQKPFLKFYPKLLEMWVHPSCHVNRYREFPLPNGNRNSGSVL